MLRNVLKFAIVPLCYALLVYKGGLNEVASLIISFILFLLLQLAWSASRQNTMPFAYTIEFILQPHFGTIMRHDAVKEYYDKVLPILKNHEAKASEGPNALDRKYSLRFIMVNGLFWSDVHKTFMDKLRTRGRILDYDISDKDIEPNLDIEIKNGLIRLWFSFSTSSGDRDRKETLICEFPLFIYNNLPYQSLDFHGIKKDSPWNEYLALRKVPDGKRYQKDLDILKRYGFAIEDQVLFLA